MRTYEFLCQKCEKPFERICSSGTLLLDLLTRQEDAIYENRFDIDLLARPLGRATPWVMEQPPSASLGIGYFGASTGAAAARQAAATFGQSIGAVV